MWSQGFVGLQGSESGVLGCLGLARGHLRSEGRAGVPGVGQKSGWKAGVLGSRGLKGMTVAAATAHGQAGFGHHWLPSIKRAKGQTPPPPNARPKTTATLFNTSLAKPDQGGRRNSESAGTPKHSEQGLHPPQPPGQLLEARNSQLPQKISHQVPATPGRPGAPNAIQTPCPG